MLSASVPQPAALLSSDVRMLCLHRDKLVAKLRQGVTLVVDRYAFSGATFTAAQELRSPLGESCFDLGWCKVAAHPYLCTAWSLRSHQGTHIQAH